MGVAGLIFEPYPPNFENQYNFWRCSSDAKNFFDFSTGFRFSKVSVECSAHICSCPCIVFGDLTSMAENIDEAKDIETKYLVYLTFYVYWIFNQFQE